MFNNNYSTVKVLRWKRFSHASYAVFNSLHKEIAIGVLAVAMLQAADLKAEGITRNAANKIVAAGDDAALADSSGVALDDLEVLGTMVPLLQAQAPRMVTVLRREDIALSAVRSVNDILQYAVGVDVRQRGEAGVQTDVSIRGGTFDQITILLNGINISSPHTGHLSADFPFSPDEIERIEVVEGPAARVFGTSAFTGVVNIVTKRATADSNIPTVSVDLRGGSYGFAAADASVRGRIKKRGQRVQEVQGSTSSPTERGQEVQGSDSQGFFYSLSGGYGRSDGAVRNGDFTNTHFFFNGGYESRRVSISTQFGYSYKPYGANTFYGASSTDQWESNERLMAAAKADIRLGNFHIAPSFYWNRWFDHYQWHRGVSPAGENYHRVDVIGGGVNAWLFSKIGKTAIGVEVKNDAIWSTSLGKVVAENERMTVGGRSARPSADGTWREYGRHDSRTNVNIHLEHNIILEQWTLSAGVLATHNSSLDSRWRFYPGVDVSYRPTERWRLFLSWNMALRMPTFTDLYYSGANIEGNTNLRPEKTNDISVGGRYRHRGVAADAQLFYSHKTDLIDWVVYADETVDDKGQPTDSKTWVYRSGNFTLDNVGMELRGEFLPREVFGDRCFLRRLSLSYAYLNENISYPRAIALSKYAQEYLRHKVIMQTDGRFCSLTVRNTPTELQWSLSWRWQQREGKGNNPYSLLDARISWQGNMGTNGARHTKSSWLSAWELYASCTNVLNHTYYDYSIVPQPGRQFMGGVKLTF